MELTPMVLYLYDGHFVPAFAGKLLWQGWCDKEVKLIMAHNIQEGFFFTNSSIKNKPELKNTIQQILPTISPNNIEYIANIFYLSIFDRLYGCKNLFT